MPMEKIVDSTAMVGLYGTMRRHQWIDEDSMTHDAYSLFVARSSAMGWSSAGPGGLIADLWGMNDAGQEWHKDHNRLCWFQVGLNLREVSPLPPIPVVPMVAGAWDSVSRVGAVDVTAVQMLVPLQLAGPAAGYLVSSSSWFSAANPADTITATVDIDTGSDASATDMIAEILAGMRSFRTQPFAVTALDQNDSMSIVAIEPPLVGDLWMGDSRNKVSFAAELPEWTAESIGWLIMLAVEGARRAGVATTALISVAQKEAG